MQTKKTTKPKPKPKVVIIPPNPTRVYGATVFSVVTDDRSKAANLVGSHGFRVSSEDAAGFHLYADALAYASYRA
jgi:hypothetical protein